MDVWIAGGELLDPAAPHRYVVRVFVPGPWRKELSEHLIARVTRAVAAFSHDSEPIYRDPIVQVHVLGVPDGGYGVFGKVIAKSTLLEMISDARRASSDPPPGMAIDPVCGATVPVVEAGAVTAVAEGVTYAFCCAGCRRQFLTHQAATGA